MAMNKRYLWILLSILFVTGCESLEDTYSDYAGDGAIRYLGSCTNVSVVPGWQRLIVTWTNGIDPVVDNVKVSWTLDGVKRDTLFEKNIDSCSLPTTENGTYEVSVCNVDNKGNNSLATTLFVRPYSYEHEAVTSFTRLVSKQYFVGDRLLLFFTGWEENITEAQLKYISKGGESKVFPITEEVANQQFIKLPEAIDPTQPVVLERQGRLIGCPDLITFEPYVLSHEKLYSSEFKIWIQEKYKQPEFNAQFVESLTELEIDYSIRSFVDILNLPNLQKLILGKNRYLYSNPGFLRNTEATSIVLEKEESLFALKEAHSANANFTVERYNQHYFNDSDIDASMSGWVESKDNPEAPVRDFMDASGWKVTCPGVDQSYISDLDLLFDGIPTTYWQPANATTARTYEIQVDMNTSQVVGGVRITQRGNSWYSAAFNDLLTPSLKIKVSKDGLIWEDATCISDVTIGNTLGEISDIEFANQQEVRYVKLVLYDQPYQNAYSISMADIQLWAPQS